MKKIFAAILFLILFTGAQNAFASTIPIRELGVLKEAFPKLNVRFDGLVELPDGTSYIPVYPVDIPKNITSANIIQTIPANQSLKDKPDFVLFNTNLALFKIIEEKDSKTIIYNEEIPYAVKMGIFPQDLLVPAGFKVPEEYKILIGNLIIPIIPTTEYREVSIEEAIQKDDAPKVELIEITAEQLANKYFYATSFNNTALSILNADTGKAFKKIDFNSIPSDIKLTNNGRYLLLSTIKNGKVFVVDTVKTNVVKELKAGEKPYQIIISENENRAYIANRDDNKISVFNLKSMQPEEDIIVTGNPCYITLSEDGERMYYLDSVTGIVYHLKKFENYFKPFSAQKLFRANNISKIQIAEDKIYTMDRGSSKIIIYNKERKPIEENLVDVSDITPVDISADSPEYNAVNIKSLEELEEKEELTFKEKTRKLFRRLLYFPEDYAPPAQDPNLENQIVVFSEEQKEVITMQVEDEDGIVIQQEVINIDTYGKNQENTTVVSNKNKTFKEKWQDFLQYKAPVEPLSPLEIEKEKVKIQMDFINPEYRANDFLIINDKIYVLCSDDYKVLVYDRLNHSLLTTFNLDPVGYYNAIKVSNDKKIGIITNISSKEITLFNTTNDVVIQKLPISVNVHNVVITGKE